MKAERFRRQKKKDKESLQMKRNSKTWNKREKWKWKKNEKLGSVRKKRSE